jgi:opacity protein-like surface antigen
MNERRHILLFLILSVVYAARAQHPVDSVRSPAIRINFSATPFQLYLFHVKPDGEPRKSTVGYLGYTAGIDLFYAPARFVHIGGSISTDKPFEEQFGGNDEQSFNQTVYALNNMTWKRWTFGYGLHYSRMNWFITAHQGSNATTLVNKQTTALGAMVDVQYQFTKNMFGRLNYRPNLMALSPNTDYRYEHMISFGIDWKFVIKRHKKQ